jgi:primosomal protein N' (replication factor Y)
MSERLTYFVDLILPLSVPNYYSYRVPYELNDRVKAGQRVIVPFGKQKLYTAIIRKVHRKVPDYQTKYIDHVLDDVPVVTEQQLKFWEWIADHYMCHIGEVMLAALPSALKLASETKVLLNPYSVRVPEEEITDSECLILDALELSQVLSLDDIGNILDRSTIYPIVKQMIDKGLILVEEELKNL